MLSRILHFIAVALLVAGGAAGTAHSAGHATGEEIRAVLDADATVAPDLRKFYESRAYEPAWVDDPGRLATLAAVLAGASAHGLDFGHAQGSLPAATPRAT